MSASILSIGQIAIAVSDIEQAKVFYQNTLGLTFLFAVPSGLAFFDCAGTRLMLTTLQGREQDHKTSVIYYKVDDIASYTEQLKQKSVTFEREPALAVKMPDHELWMGFIRDPDQNLIGIMAELPLSA